MRNPGKAFFLLLPLILLGAPRDLRSAAPGLPACDRPELPVVDPRIFEDIHRNLGCPIFESRIGAQNFPRLDSEHGKLSALWAQEEVGSDIGKDFINRWDSEHKDSPTHDVAVGILDVGIQLAGFGGSNLSASLQQCQAQPSSCPGLGTQTHGTSVGNLVVGPVGVSGHAHLSRVDSGGQVGLDLGAAYRRMGAPGTDHPEIVNMSIGEGLISAEARTELERMSAGTIAVHAAGNSYPAPLTPYLASTRGIVVGSLSPEGLPSDFSSAGGAVAISAPADYSVTSMRPEGNSQARHLVEFGGTSGAAPIVSGALANAASFLPGLTTEEAKVLLARTAVPTSGFEPPSGQEGAGSVNAYAMIRVAANLRAAGWPANRALLKDPPPDPAIFDFGREAGALKAQAFAKLKQFSCDEQKEAAVLLRTAFFLNPRDPQIRSSLGELYRANGFLAQAAFFESRGSFKAIQDIQEPGPKLALGVRSGLDPATLFPSAKDRRAAYVEAFRVQDIYEESLEQLARRALGDPSPSVHSAFLETVPSHLPGWARTILARTALSEAREPSLRAQAMHEACVHLPASMLSELLPIAAADASAEVRGQAAGCAATCRALYAPARGSAASPASRDQLADCDRISAPAR